MKIFSVPFTTESAFTASSDGGQLSLGFQFDDSFEQSDWFCLHLGTCGGDDVALTLTWYDRPEGTSGPYLEQRIIAGCTSVLSFSISESTLALGKAFAPPYAALRKGDYKGIPADKPAIRFARLTIRSESPFSVELHGAFLSDSRPVSHLEGKPLVDRFGQRIYGDWPGKIHSEEELHAYLTAEYQKAQTASDYPEGWSRWGGWLKKRFRATGFFRTESDGTRRWLVDPDGYAFYSNGMCYGERAGIYTVTEEYRNLYEWLPDSDGDYADAWSHAANIPQYLVRNGSEGAGQRPMFNFARANLIRVFGSDWHRAYSLITASRLKKMGFNTIGVGTNDYFDEQTEAFLELSGIPFVITFRDFPLTEERIFRDFPDVFHPEYRERCRAFARRSLEKYRGNPYLIGYFVTNEPEWLFAEDVNLTERLLAQRGCMASRQAFLAQLRDSYQTIDALNQAWNTSFSDFDDLLQPVPALYGRTERLNRDFERFEHLLVMTYGQLVSEELKQYDPDHLNLGMRYSHLSERTLKFNLDYFDLFSINRYSESPAGDAASIAEHHDHPVIVGEWHVGASDSGLPRYGICYTDTQEKRAEACRYYLQTAVSSPNIVGTHYFEYNDQPFFGRFDGECYQIGLVDVCQKPYSLLCDMFAEAAQQLYPMKNGELPVTAERIPLKR